MSKSFFNDYYEQDPPIELLNFYRIYPSGLKNNMNVIFNFKNAMLQNEELGLEEDNQFFIGYSNSLIIVYDMSDSTLYLRDKEDIDIVENEFRNFEELVDWFMDQ